MTRRTLSGSSLARKIDDGEFERAKVNGKFINFWDDRHQERAERFVAYLRTLSSVAVRIDDEDLTFETEMTF